jgi:hypothetical protein
MGQKKKAAQTGKNAAAKKGKIAVDIRDGSNQPLLLLMVKYSADANEDCFKNNDTPDHDLPVSRLCPPKRYNGRSFSDRKDGDTSLASYASAPTSASAKIVCTLLKNEYR